MDPRTTPTVLCLASYEKGAPFLREAKRLGWRVLLLTTTALERAAWPRDAIGAVYYMDALEDLGEVTRAVSWLARTEHIDRIVPLDEFDQETAAHLREHMALPGMGVSEARAFRDKLAMRVRAASAEVPVPPFARVLNHGELRRFTEETPPPWLLKPRSEASAMGIRRVGAEEELWAVLDELGDRQSWFVLERFVPGDVCHVDALVAGGAVVFAEASAYIRPPLEIYQGGEVFATRTLPRHAPETRELLELNARALGALGMRRGVAHAEYIRAAEDGRLVFLEAAARVGGAGVAELVEAASGVNLWAAWARLELGDPTHDLADPRTRAEYAGLVVSLARQERPDTSTYADPEVVWRMEKRHHAGLVVRSPDLERVGELTEAYPRRFREDFLAVLPPLEEHTSEL